MRRIRSPKLLATVGVACLLSSMALPALTATPAGADPGELQTQTFIELGKTLRFTVPADTPTLHIRAVGGSGASGRYGCFDNGLCRPGGAGGHGGVVDMDLPVTPGQEILIGLGRAGTNVKPGTGGASGGWAGQDSRFIVLDAGTGHGGGATFVNRPDGSVMAVAAGGGGGGGSSLAFENPTGSGGDGGDGVDGRGHAGHDAIYAGAGGVGSSGKQAGGDGQSSVSDASAGGGGGGGGGYQLNGTGGGAGGKSGSQVVVGGAGGGGAGGHSFSIASNASIAPATGFGDGQVVITWTSRFRVTPTTGSISSSANPSWLGEPVTFTADLQFGNGIGYGLNKERGMVTIGTFDPATGVETAQAYWNLADFAGRFLPSTGITWTVVLPTGLTQVWASYSGDPWNSPWKSPYFTQLVGPLRPRTVLALPSSSVDFGSQSLGTTTTKTVTIENNSAAPWKITGTSISSPQFRWTGGTCSSTALSLNARCTIELSFTPTGVPAVRGTLTLTDEVGTPTVITMAGSGSTGTGSSGSSSSSGSGSTGSGITGSGAPVGLVSVGCLAPTSCAAPSPLGGDRAKVRVPSPGATSSGQRRRFGT